MNYVDEDTSFERWCENNYLHMYSQAIWKKLFKRFNRSGWCEWVTVDNLTLMAEVQIKNEKTFIGYRDKLVEAGLIEYIKGKKGSPNKYKLISLNKCTGNKPVHSTVETTVNPTVETTVHSTVETTVNSTDITKLNKTKQNNSKEKKEKKENPPPIPFDEILAEESEAYKKSILEFVAHKNNLKKPFLSEQQFKKWLEKLKKMGDTQTQMDIIEQSIAEGWQGVFPLKSNTANIQTPKPSTSKLEQKLKNIFKYDSDDVVGEYDDEGWKVYE